MAFNSDMILKSHQIRSTDCRRDILSYFAKKGYAISFPQLEKALKQHDRTSIFRNIIFFEENGFIHKLNDAEGIIKYALCEEKCFGHVHHHEEHIHFTCSKCHQTFCLEEVKLPKLKMPDGFHLDGITLNAKGICKICAAL